MIGSTIIVSFELTHGELKEARRRIIPGMKILWLTIGFLALLFLWFFLSSISEGTSSATTRPAGANLLELLLPFLPMIIVATVFVPLWIKIQRTIRTRWQNPIATGSKAMTLDATGIRTVQSLCETFYRWEAVETVTLSKNLYLLSVWSMVLIVPKHVFTSEQLAQFEHLIRSQVMERAGGFPSRVTPPPLPTLSDQEGSA